MATTLIHTMMAQEASVLPQLEGASNQETQQEVTHEGENWSACWLDDIQQIMTVELLLGQQEYSTPTTNHPPHVSWWTADQPVAW